MSNAHIVIQWNTSTQSDSVTDELVTINIGDCSTAYSSTSSDISDDTVHKNSSSATFESTNGKFSIYVTEAILTPALLYRRKEMSHIFAVIITEVTAKHHSELEVGKFTSQHCRLCPTVPFVEFTCKDDQICIILESDIFSDMVVEMIVVFDDNESIGGNTPVNIMILGLPILLLPKYKGGLVSLINYHKGHTSLQFSQLMITVLREGAQLLLLHKSFGELNSFFPEREFHRLCTEVRISKGSSARNASGVWLQRFSKISLENIQKFQNISINDSILINEPSSHIDRSLAQASSAERTVITSKLDKRGVAIRYEHQDNNGIEISLKCHEEIHHDTADCYEFEKLKKYSALRKDQCDTEVFARGVYKSVSPETIQEFSSDVVELSTTYSENAEILLWVPPRKQMPIHGTG